MVNQLARVTAGLAKAKPVDHVVKPALKQLHEVVAGNAAHANSTLIIAAELTLADVAVIATEALLCHQLQAESGRLGAALAMLARAIIALVKRALGTAPEVSAQTAVNFML